METMRRRKICFYTLVAVSFLMILAFNLLTPLLTDDFSYGAQVREARSFLDLLRQEQYQYMTWNGRSVVHLLLRCFLTIPVIIFKIANSFVFVLFSYLIYANIERRRAYDCFVWLMVQAGLWFFAVDFAQTVLWETGACNYLWGTTIILLFMTALRRQYRKEGETGGTAAGKGAAASGRRGTARRLATVAGFFAFGIVAGWCNENTSGGAFLFTLFLLVYYGKYYGTELHGAGRRQGAAESGIGAGRRQAAAGKGRGTARRLPLFGIAASLGNLLGLLVMVAAPGNAIRASFSVENHTGLVGLLARTQKVTLNLGEHFEVLLGLLVVTLVVAALQRRPRRMLMNEGVFAFLFLATSYALILTAETQARAFFGAGIFLIIACVQGVSDACAWERETERRGSAGTGLVLRAAAYGALGVLLLQLFFTYVDCGTNLGRIYRECAERESYVVQARERGETSVVVAQLRPAFANRFSAAYDGDLREDAGYWTNVAFAGFYGMESVSAVPREEWDALREIE